MNVKRDKLPIIIFLIVLLFLIVYKQFFFQTPPIEITNNTLPLKLAWVDKSEEGLLIPPVSNGEIIAVMDRKGAITAFNSQSGKQLWHYEIGKRLGTSSYSKWAIGEEMLILSPDNSTLLALNAQTGEKIWQTSLTSPLWDFPTIVIEDEMVVIGAWDEDTNGYIAGHRLYDGLFSWELSFPAHDYRFLFNCSSIPTQDGLLENTICMIPNDKILVIDSTNDWPTKLSRIQEIYEPIHTLNTPVYADGFIFTNPSPDPAISVFDTVQNNASKLPANCSKEIVAQPVTIHDAQVLVANGCNEVYVLNTAHLDEDPNWIFQSPDELYSSFVTLDGETGYFLNEKAEIMGIDLLTGNQVGRISLSPEDLQPNSFMHHLVVDKDHMIVVLNNRDILVFSSANY